MVLILVLLIHTISNGNTKYYQYDQLVIAHTNVPLVMSHWQYPVLMPNWLVVWIMDCSFLYIGKFVIPSPK